MDLKQGKLILPFYRLEAIANPLCIHYDTALDTSDNPKSMPKVIQLSESALEKALKYVYCKEQQRIILINPYNMVLL